MALILEITKADGSVHTQPIEGAEQVIAQPGDQFRVIDSVTGAEPAGMVAAREGKDLVINGLPDMAPIALCDFFKEGEHEACSLVMESGEVIAPSVAPVQLAQTKDAAKDAAKQEMEKKSAEMKDKAGLTAAPEKAATATESSEKAATAAKATEADAAAAASNPAFSTTGVAVGAIALVGIAAAAGGGSDDNGGGSTPAPAPTPPPAPTGGGIDSADLGGDNAVGFSEASDGLTFTGTAEAGSTVDVTLVGPSGATTATGSAVADSAGNYSVAIPGGSGTALDGLPSGSYTASVTATNATGTSTATSGPAFTLLPQSPNTVDPEGPDTIIDVSELAGGIEVSGVTEPNAMVDVALLDTGGNVVSSATTVTADGSGNFTATVPETGVTSGTYNLRTTTTSNGLVSDAPNFTGIQIDAGVNGDGTDNVLVAGSSNSVSAGGGADVVVGDNGGVIRNGNFEFWDTMTASTWDPDGGNGGVAGNGAFSFNSGVGADLGWAMSIGAAPIDGGGDPGVLATTDGTNNGEPQDYFNYGAGNSGGVGGVPDPVDGRVEFLDLNTGDSGIGADQYAWDTQSIPQNGGGGLTQDVYTVSGQSYTLTVSVDPTTSAAPGSGGEDTILQVQWDGAVIATRETDGTWSGSNPPGVTTAGETDYVFTLPASTTGTTTLSLVAFDRHFDTNGNNGTDPTDQGNDDGLIVTGVTLANAGASDNDTLSGGAGADVIFGQGGDDTIYGGANGAADTDADTFVYQMGTDNGSDQIMDFDTANDRIVVTDVLNVAGAAETFAQGTDSDMALDINDLTSVGVQEITLSGAAGTNDLVLSFSSGGTSMGQVTLVGVNATTYADVNAMLTAGVLEVTGDGFNPDL